MSQETVELARRGYAALNDAYSSGDVNDLWPTAEELWDPEIVLRTPGGVLGGGEVWHGRDGMLRFVANQMEAFRRMWIEPQESIDAGDRLVVPVRFGGQARYLFCRQRGCCANHPATVGSFRDARLAPRGYVPRGL
jgi:SnoaL-like domain